MITLCTHPSMLLIQFSIIERSHVSSIFLHLFSLSPLLFRLVSVFAQVSLEAFKHFFILKSFPLPVYPEQQKKYHETVFSTYPVILQTFSSSFIFVNQTLKCSECRSSIACHSPVIELYFSLSICFSLVRLFPPLFFPILLPGPVDPDISHGPSRK